MNYRHVVFELCLTIFLGASHANSGWQWINASPQGFDLNGVSAVSNQDIIAIGNHGTTLHWDGWCWTDLRSRTTNNLLDVGYASSTGFIAVGQNGIILRWTGIRWEEMPSPTTQNLRALWCSESGLAVAVGDNGTVIVFDGNTWFAANSPTTASLYSVWGSSVSDLWVGGDSGQLFRWYDMGWSAFQIDPPVRLTGIGGTGPSDVFVFGSMFFFPIIRHFNGSEWSDVSHEIAFYPLVFESGNLIVHPDGTIQAIGSCHDSSGHGDDTAYLIQWDGTTWGKTALGYGSPQKIAGISLDQLAIVGKNGFIIRQDGTERIRDSRIYPLGVREFSSLSSNDIHVLDCGNYPFLADEIVHWNGLFWDQQYLNGSANDIWVNRSTDIYTVGNNGFSNWFNGSEWIDLDTHTTQTLNQIHSPSAGVLYAVGNAGTIIRMQNQTWNAQASGTTQNLRAIWGWNDTGLFAAGDEGVLLHGDGTSWLPIESGVSSDLTAIHGIDADHACAVGRSGTILRYHENLWTPVESPDSSDFFDVRMTSPETIFLAGQSGVFRWDGSTWHHPLKSIAAYTLSISRSGDLFASINGGLVKWLGPDADIGVDIKISQPFVTPGDLFWCRAYLFNFDQSTMTHYPLYVLLEVAGTFYFWPGWTDCDPPESCGVDFRFIDLPVGWTTLDVIPPFIWPDTGDSEILDLHFYAALLNPEQTAIIGEWSHLQWGFGPS